MDGTILVLGGGNTVIIQSLYSLPTYVMLLSITFKSVEIRQTKKGFSFAWL